MYRGLELKTDIGQNGVEIAKNVSNLLLLLPLNILTLSLHHLITEGTPSSPYTTDSHTPPIHHSPCLAATRLVNSSLRGGIIVTLPLPLAIRSICKISKSA